MNTSVLCEFSACGGTASEVGIRSSEYRVTINSDQYASSGTGSPTPVLYREVFLTSKLSLYHTLTLEK